MRKTSSSLPGSYPGLSGSFFIDTSSSGRAACHLMTATWAIMGRAKGSNWQTWYLLSSLLVVFFPLGFLAIRKVFNAHGHPIGTLVFGNSSLRGGEYLSVGMLVLVAHKEVT